MKARSIRHRLRPLIALVLAVSLVALTATAPAQGGHSASAKKGQRLHLTALVKKASQGGSTQTVKLALEKKSKTVGNAKFPGCAGTGSSIVCGGKVTIKHMGRGMDTIITWSCETTPPFKCLPGKGTLTKHGKAVGTIKIKKKPFYKKGETFPVLVIRK